MHKMEELRDMLINELERCTKKGELSAGSLDVIDKLTHSIKSIDTIMAMEDAGYSNEGGNYSMRGGRYSGENYSYARGRNAKRDSMGRYSRDSYGYNRGYSRDDAKSELMDALNEVSESTNDSKMKRMIQNWMNEAESM